MPPTMIQCLKDKKGWTCFCSACKSPSKPESILDEAARITGDGGARNDAYDHPMPNFSKIAVGWSVILGSTVTPRQVAHMMIWMKLVRDNHKPQRDNLVDIAGYANCIDRLEEYNDDVPYVAYSATGDDLRC